MCFAYGMLHENSISVVITETMSDDEDDPVVLEVNIHYEISSLEDIYEKCKLTYLYDHIDPVRKLHAPKISTYQQTLVMKSTLCRI